MKNKEIIKACMGASAVAGIAFFGYLNFEPQMADAVSDPITVTQAVTSEITITSPANVTMSSSIAGMSGGSSTGSATWTVKTNDTSGFNMKIKSDAINCLRNGSDHFNDYTEAVGGTPDYSWIAPAVSGFGYTVEPATAVDTAAAFKDNGSACNTGSGNTADKCWDGLSTTDATIVNRAGITTSAGEAEVVKFQAALASGQFLPEGNYVATVTVTALTN